MHILRYIKQTSGQYSDKHLSKMTKQMVII